MISATCARCNDEGDIERWYDPRLINVPSEVYLKWTRMGYSRYRVRQILNTLGIGCSRCPEVGFIGMGLLLTYIYALGVGRNI
jgi:hypothetical protein